MEKKPNYTERMGQFLLGGNFTYSQISGVPTVEYLGTGHQADLFLVTLNYTEGGEEFTRKLVDKRFLDIPGKSRRIWPFKKSEKERYMTPWEIEFRALSYAFNNVFHDSDYKPVPRPFHLSRNNRFIIREYVEGPTLEARLSGIDQAIRKRVSEIDGVKSSKDLKKVSEDLDFLASNRRAYIEAAVRLIANTHKRLRTNLKSEERDAMDSPGKEAYADDVTKHIRRILERRGKVVDPAYLRELRQAFLNTEIARLLEESRETPIVYDFRPSNIIIRGETEDIVGIEDRLCDEKREPQRIERDMVILDWGKFRLGPVQTDLVTLLYNVQLGLKGDQINELVEVYTHSTEPRMTAREYAEFLRQMKLVAIPTLIHAADSEYIPEEGAEYLRKTAVLLTEDISEPGTKEFKSLLGEQLDELKNGNGISVVPLRRPGEKDEHRTPSGFDTR